MWRQSNDKGLSVTSQAVEAQSIGQVNQEQEKAPAGTCVKQTGKSSRMWQCKV